MNYIVVSVHVYYILQKSNLECQFLKFRNITFSVQNRLVHQLSPIIPLLLNTQCSNRNVYRKKYSGWESGNTPSASDG